MSRVLFSLLLAAGIFAAQAQQVPASSVGGATRAAVAIPNIQDIQDRIDLIPNQQPVQQVAPSAIGVSRSSGSGVNQQSISGICVLGSATNSGMINSVNPYGICPAGYGFHMTSYDLGHQSGGR